MGKLLHTTWLHTLAPLVPLPERIIAKVSKCMHDRFKIRSKERHTNARSIAGFEYSYIVVICVHLFNYVIYPLPEKVKVVKVNTPLRKTMFGMALCVKFELPGLIEFILEKTQKTYLVLLDVD